MRWLRFVSLALIWGCPSDDDGMTDAGPDADAIVADAPIDGFVPALPECQMDVHAIHFDPSPTPNTTLRPLVPISAGVAVFEAFEGDEPTLVAANADTRRTLIAAGQEYSFPDDFSGPIVATAYGVGRLTDDGGNAERVFALLDVADGIERRRFLARLRFGALGDPGVATIEPIFTPGDDIDGQPAGAFGNLQMDEFGNLAATAELGMLPDTLGALVRFPEDGTPRIALRAGDPLSGGVALSGFGNALRVGPDWFLTGGVEGALTLGRFNEDFASFRCLATTGTTIDCARRSVPMIVAPTFSRGAMAIQLGTEALRLTDDGEHLVQAGTMADVEVGNPSSPVLCSTTDDLYFVSETLPAHEVLVMRADGTIEQVTNFTTLNEDDDFVGPNRIEGIALNEECEVLITARDGSGYFGLWMVWSDGTLARVIDQGAQVDVDGTMRTVATVKVSLGTNGLDEGYDGRVSSIDNDGNVAIVVEYDAGMGSLVNAGIVLATKPADRCRPPNVVNTTGDASDSAPGDGFCDTGSTAPNGDPECTLRAALEEANARAGAESIRFDLESAAVIRPGSALPSVSDELRIEGADVVLEGSGVAFDVLADFALDGLTARGFDTVVSASGSEVTITDVVFEDLCAWAILTDDRLTLRDSRIQRAGTGDGCSGGGVLSVDDEEITKLRLTNVELLDNGGPGVLSAGPMRLEAVTAERNDGPGIATAAIDTAGVLTRIYIGNGRTRVAENRGPGFFLELGHLATEIGGSIEVVDNESWGLLLENGQVFIGGAFLPANESTISNNGPAGTPTSVWEFEGGDPVQLVLTDGFGGGVLLDTPDDVGEVEVPSRFQVVRIEGNDGPGILSSTEVRLALSNIVDNLGDGVVVSNTDGGLIRPLVTSVLGGVSITGNRGHGVVTKPGGVSFGATMGSMPWTISDNGGWGVVAEGHGVQAFGMSTSDHRIERNGAGADCRFFELITSGPNATESTCGGGGIVASGNDELDESRVVRTVIRDNQGPGILSDGLVIASFATIEGNSGDGIAAIPEGTSGASVRINDSDVIGNLGRGIYADDGGVDATGQLRVENNAGWGMQVALGDVSFATPGTDQSTFRSNGDGPTCWRWTISPLAGTSEACSGGGLSLEDGDLNASFLTVRDHTNTGIEVVGDLSINVGRLCNNGIDTSVTGTETLTSVESVCP